jgi:deoxyadenosine/deoxycytidine kinase
LESEGLATVLRETVSSGILGLFYPDPKRYGFAMQYAMLLKRNYQAELLRYESLVPEVQRLVWDRSKLGDLLFAILNHLLGSISVAEFAAYLEEFGCSTVRDLSGLDFVQRLTHVAFLFDDPENCRSRVLERGHDSEKDIPEAYYHALEDVHVALVLLLLESEIATRVRVVCLGWGEYDEPSTFLQTVDAKPNLRFERDLVFRAEELVDQPVIRTLEELESPLKVDSVLHAAGKTGRVFIDQDLFESQTRTLKEMRAGPWKSIVTDHAECSKFATSFAMFSPVMRRFLARAFSATAGICVFRTIS